MLKLPNASTSLPVFSATRDADFLHWPHIPPDVGNITNSPGAMSSSAIMLDLAVIISHSRNKHKPCAVDEKRRRSWGSFYGQLVDPAKASHSLFLMVVVVVGYGTS